MAIETVTAAELAPPGPSNTEINNSSTGPSVLEVKSSLKEGTSDEQAKTSDRLDEILDRLSILENTVRGSRYAASAPSVDAPRASEIDDAPPPVTEPSAPADEPPAASADKPAEPAADARAKSRPEVNYMIHADYFKRKFDYSAPHAAVDVVWTVASQRLDAAKTAEKNGTAKPTLKSPSSSLSPEHALPPPGNPLVDGPEPLRYIQINSKALQMCFEEETNDPMVIFAPFKSLTYKEKSLREKLKVLEEKWGQSEEPPTFETVLIHAPGNDKAEGTDSKPAVDEKSKPAISTEVAPETETHSNADPNESTNETKAEFKPPTEEEDDRTEHGRKAYTDLKVYLEFYDKWVKPRWDALRGNKVKLVHYCDLPTLFQPGDEVLMPGNSQKVWRVLKITGGRPLVNHLLATDYEDTLYSESGPSESTSSSSKTTHEGAGRKTVTDRAKWSSFHVEGYYIDWNGVEFGAVHMTASIPFFPGRRDIEFLRPYPLRCVEESGVTRLSLIEEGKKFLLRAQTGLQYYDGRTLTKKPKGDSLLSDVKTYTDAGSVARSVRAEDVSSQVVVDFEKCFQYNPDWSPQFGIETFKAHDDKEWDRDLIPDKHPVQLCYIQFLDFWDSIITNDFRKSDEWAQVNGEPATDDRDRFQDEDYILLPDRLFGFVLRSRTWACFDSRYLQPVEKEESGWNDLQLPRDHKRTLESLIERHFKNKDTAGGRPGHESLDFDFVHGKGKGLIILLHGPPGVGKTSTAETIASKYHKPLLPITCGNLGLDSQAVERSLTENFVLAQAWGCIVLLDEADVFLAARSKDDVHRNALVSVFLRTLEYYTGVLFLTSNRPGSFDEAFRSRIHYALYYDNLGKAETEAIWRTNLKRLITHKERISQTLTVDDDGEPIIQYALTHYEALKHQGRTVWNGRQIRNAFQTAVALAEYDAREGGIEPQLHWKHFRNVVLASDQFEMYLVDTRGNTEAELADWSGVRANYPNLESAGAYQKTQPRRGHRMSMKESYDMMSDLHPNAIFPPPMLPQDNVFFDPNRNRQAPNSSQLLTPMMPQQGMTLPRPQQQQQQQTQQSPYSTPQAPQQGLNPMYSPGMQQQTPQQPYGYQSQSSPAISPGQTSISQQAPQNYPQMSYQTQPQQPQQPPPQQPQFGAYQQTQFSTGVPQYQQPHQMYTTPPQPQQTQQPQQAWSQQPPPTQQTESQAAVPGAPA